MRHTRTYDDLLRSSAGRRCQHAILLPLGLLPLLFLASGAAAAAREFEGRISFVLPPYGERLVATGAGVAEVAPTPSLETLSLHGFVGGSTVIPVTDPLVSNGGLVALRVGASFHSADLHLSPPTASSTEWVLSDGTLPVRGEIRLCLLLPDCSTGFSIPLTGSSPNRGIGVGGLLTTGASQTVIFSVYGAPFTIGTATVMGATDSGALYTLASVGRLHGPASFPSTAGLTQGGFGGVVAMVTPVRVASSPAAPGENDFPGFARVEIQLLPEPGLLVPLLIATAALFTAGHRRQRKAARQRPQPEAPCGD